MSAEIEQELRAMFDDLSDWVMPHADLADRVRQAAHRRRRILAIVVTVAAAVSSGVGYAVASVTGPHGRPGVVTGHKTVRHHVTGGLTIAGGPELLATGGPYLYAATGDYPDAALAAYSRVTGLLVHQISVPAMPSALRIGPDGLIWLAFYPDQNGGGTGIWLLSPDLTRRSVLNLAVDRYHGAAIFAVLPTGPLSALLATDQGMAMVRFPAPDSHGQPTLRWAPPSSIPSEPRFGLPTALTMVGGKAAVRQQRDGPINSTLSFAGQAGPVSHALIGSMAGQGNGLWITVDNVNGPTATLLRLNDQLQPVTPRAISQNPLFAAPQRVWTNGSTVWVIRSGQPYLACFSYHGQVGPIATIRTSLPPTELAAAGDTVYVADSAGVASYHVPAACR